MMLNKNDIIRILSENKHYIDEFILDAFIKNWKIEAIYEDENGVEFFDESALEKVRSALCDKSELQKEACEIEIVNKEEPSTEIQTEDLCQNSSEVQEPKIEIVEANVQPIEYQSKIEPELKNVTLNITNQTLNVLAQTIAEKITGDISGYLKQTDILEEALRAGSFKRDNEILSSKLQEVLGDNKILIKRIQELEKEKDAYLHVVANVYVKKPR